MISVAIVEDDERETAQLKSFLKKYEQESGNQVQITCFSNGLQIVTNYRANYDIILMDVEMPQMDGFSAAERIRESDTEVIILFITNMGQYAIRGYAVDALDYVLKPVNYFAFSQRMEKAVAKLKKRKGNYIVVSTREGSQRIDISTITYIESMGHTLVYHTGEGTLSNTGTIKELEEKLEEYGFSRCNKGYLVNLHYVDAVRDGCVIVNGESLVISRGRRAAFMEALAKYV